ncbi:MAG: excinuclease ABC subunit C, partial [Telluria sp.]
MTKEVRSNEQPALPAASDASDAPHEIQEAPAIYVAAGGAAMPALPSEPTRRERAAKNRAKAEGQAEGAPRARPDAWQAMK